MGESSEPPYVGSYTLQGKVSLVFNDLRTRFMGSLHLLPHAHWDLDPGLGAENTRQHLECGALAPLWIGYQYSPNQLSGSDGMRSPQSRAPVNRRTPGAGASSGAQRWNARPLRSG